MAAVELGWGGVARGGGSSVRKGGRCGVWARCVGDHGKQEVAGALHGSGRQRSVPAALKQRSREVEDRVWTSLQIQKIPGTLL